MLESFGFKQHALRECLFKKKMHKSWVLILVYVDDLEIMGSPVNGASWVYEKFGSLIKLTYLK